MPALLTTTSGVPNCVEHGLDGGLVGDRGRERWRRVPLPCRCSADDVDVEHADPVAGGGAAAAIAAPSPRPPPVTSIDALRRHDRASSSLIGSGRTSSVTTVGG